MPWVKLETKMTEVSEMDHLYAALHHYDLEGVRQHLVGANDPDEDGWTALFFASTQHFDAAMQYLILDGKANVNHRDVCGRTPLMIATAAVCVEGMRVLLAHGADPNAVSDCGNTPLNIALYACDVAAVHTLVAHGARVSPCFFSHNTVLNRVLRTAVKIRVAFLWARVRQFVTARVVAFYLMELAVARHCAPGGKYRAEDRRAFISYVPSSSRS